MAAARHYEEAGLGELVRLPRPVARSAPAWHLYVVRHERIDAIARSLTEAGHGQRAYYRVPIHRQPAMRQYSPGAPLPGTEAAARTHLAIPMSPVLNGDQAVEVTETIRSAVKTGAPVS
jgi:dTDP-4-amino-4,6-dideoxygalactose transaminase